MTPIPRLVGMVHLAPLPGSPRFSGDFAAVLDAAVEDARLLASAGFPALMVENFGDVPFHPDSVAPETVAAIALCADAVRQTTRLPVGVNVLRNDALAALGIAAAAGCSFIRVNVLTGVMYTDQGPIAGRAAAVLRKRRELDIDAEIWADVMVKHATPPPGSDLRQMTEDVVERGLADGIILSGPATGVKPDLAEAAAVKDALPQGTRLIIGSGATVDNLAELLQVANTVIVGSSVKRDGRAMNSVDPDRAGALVVRASNLGLV